MEAEAEKENQEEDVDLAPHEHERVLKGAYKSFVIHAAPKRDIVSYFNQTTHQDVNRKPAKGNGVCKENHDPMGDIKEAHNATH